MGRNRISLDSPRLRLVYHPQQLLFSSFFLPSPLSRIMWPRMSGFVVPGPGRIPSLQNSIFQSTCDGRSRFLLLGRLILRWLIFPLVNSPSVCLVRILDGVLMVRSFRTSVVLDVLLILFLISLSMDTLR